MIKLQHASLVFLSGLLWLAMGLFLLPLGLNLLIGTVQSPAESYPLMDFLASFLGDRERIALLLIAIGLFVGHMKGRMVLGKTVIKSVERIRALPNPASLSRIYSKKYYILLGSMVFIGMLMKLVSNDIRGTIDVIIGSALINGALLYFRAAYSVRKVPVS